MRLLMLLFYLVLIILAVAFAALNASTVQVNFYFTTVSMPISVLIILILGLGILIGSILFLGRYWHLKTDYRKIKSQLNLMEKEIKNLRSIPLQDQH